MNDIQAVTDVPFRVVLEWTLMVGDDIQHPLAHAKKQDSKEEI